MDAPAGTRTGAWIRVPKLSPHGRAGSVPSRGSSDSRVRCRTGGGATAARLYWESFGKRIQDPVRVPAGASIFPKEIYRPSRRWAEPQFRDLRYWNELDKGGHFAAMEQPMTFVDEVQAAFR